MNEKIEHVRSVGKVHVFEKIRLAEELKRLLKMVKRVTWDATIKVT